MSLFGNRSFVVGVAAIFLFYSAISSFFLSLTMLLQAGAGLSPFIAGAVFTPSAIGFFAGALASPRLSNAFGHRVLLFGVLTFSAGLALSAVTAATAPANMSLLIVSLILNGVGQGIVIPLAFNFILSGVREQQVGQGSGTLTTMQTIGTSVGVAIVGVLLFSLVETHKASSVNAQLLGYAHGFAVATLYNVAAALGSLALFWAAGRKAHEHEPAARSH
jgi:MFS family permease